LRHISLQTVIYMLFVPAGMAIYERRKEFVAYTIRGA